MTAPEWNTGWMRDAACARIPGLPWTEGGKLPPLLVDLMAQTCAACPVIAECAEFADEAEVTAGWWAGESRDNRRLSLFGTVDRCLPAFLDVDSGADPDAA